MFGTFRIAVGGQTPGEDGPGRGQKRKQADTVEPVFWHSRPAKLYEEMLHSYCLCAVIDCTLGDGELALVCARSRTPYFGVGLTTAHVAAVRDRLIDAVMHGMLEESDPLYDPKLAGLMKPVAPTAAKGGQKGGSAATAGQKGGSAATTGQGGSGATTGHGGSGATAAKGGSAGDSGSAEHGREMDGENSADGADPAVDAFKKKLQEIKKAAAGSASGSGAAAAT